MKNKLLSQIGNEAYWTLNKRLAKQLGLNEALLLQHFIDLQFKLFDGKEFYQQQDRILDELPMGERTLRSAIKKLVDLDILNVEKKGLPAKYWYTINSELVLGLLDGSVELQSLRSEATSPCETQPLDVAKCNRKEKNLIKKELIEKELNNSIVHIIPKEGKFNSWKQVEEYLKENNLEFIPEIGCVKGFYSNLTFQKANLDKQLQMIKNNTVQLQFN